VTQNGDQTRRPDAAAILDSVGEAAYEWRLDADTLTWSGNAQDALGVELGEVTSGRAFALHVEAEAGQSRADVLLSVAQIDTGHGVPDLIEYGFKSADEQIAAVRDERLVVNDGPVVVTITVGGVTAPLHAHTVPEVFARAVDAMHAARVRRHGSFAVYQPNQERDARRRANLRATDEIVGALNDRRIGLAFEPVVQSQTRAVGFQECLMRVVRSDGSLVPAGEMVRVAERLGLVRMLDHRELVLHELAADPNLKASVNVSAAATLEGDWGQSRCARARLRKRRRAAHRGDHRARRNR
jgi:hypothetical protein